MALNDKPERDSCSVDDRERITNQKDADDQLLLDERDRTASLDDKYLKYEQLVNYGC